MEIQIKKLGSENAEVVFEWVTRLLMELGEEGEELGTLNKDAVLKAWKEIENRYSAFVAYDENQNVIGICTLMESFAIYANGNYGIIDEMYVHPDYRSQSVGARLISAVVDHGRQKSWTRIDVTAPENERWCRTRAFYEKRGFIFTGPKLKKLL
jgi:GNAT superfamily N-acetyltransferase